MDSFKGGVLHSITENQYGEYIVQDSLRGMPLARLQ
jgi:hypothetical protein